MIKENSIEDGKILISCGDEKDTRFFNLSKHNSSLSQFIKNATDFEPVIKPVIKLMIKPMIKPDVFEKVIQYLNHYEGINPPYTFKKPINSNKMKNIKIICNISGDEKCLGDIDPWAVKFTDDIIDQTLEVYDENQFRILSELLLVSNYLIVLPLYELISIKFSTLLKGLDGKKTCRKFKIDPDIVKNDNLITNIEKDYPKLLL